MGCHGAEGLARGCQIGRWEDRDVRFASDDEGPGVQWCEFPCLLRK
jgi:hypothetical protein